MWISHGDPYYVLGSHVVTMSWVLIAFVILKVFENGWFTRLITFSFLVISILLWINIHLIRSEYLSDSEKYLDAIRQSSEYHWAVFIFLGLSLALQGVSVVYAVKKKREVLKSESYP
jgi:drug/metabolite transporter (DMT)-like permease